MSGDRRDRARGPEATGRLVWALFCERHSTDDSGKNSYIGVFDTLTVAVKAPPGQPPATEPLPEPVATSAFVLALHITTEPGSPGYEVRVKDSDGATVLQPLRSRLKENAQGRHNVHVAFPRGLPVVRSGIFSFEVYVEGARIGEAQIAVSIDPG